MDKPLYLHYIIETKLMGTRTVELRTEYECYGGPLHSSNSYIMKIDSSFMYTEFAVRTSETWNRISPRSVDLLIDLKCV